jgi:hypothetical protein
MDNTSYYIYVIIVLYMIWLFGLYKMQYYQKYNKTLNQLQSWLDCTMEIDKLIAQSKTKSKLNIPTNSNTPLIEGFDDTCYYNGRICTPEKKCKATKEDIQHAQKYAIGRLCKEGGFSYIDGGEVKYDCKHTELTCNRDSSFPSTKEKTYLEWNVPKGACISGMEANRVFCKLGNFDKLKYDTDYGKCYVTPEHCHSFGADWTGNDCEIPKGQAFGEKMTGTTMVRALKHGFQC